jgi:hypothetical protein
METGEILKSGAIDKAADLLHKLAGPAFEEFGAMLGDRVRVYRLKNLVQVLEKTKEILRDAGLPATEVPPRLLLPIIEHSSIEDEESLQLLWAGLLATSSQEKNTVSPSFIDTLKQLTPDEARHFEHVIQTIRQTQRRDINTRTVIPTYAFTESWQAPSGVTADTFERLGLIRRDFDVKIRNKNSLMNPPTTIKQAFDAIDPEMRYRFVLTQYAVRFLEACDGPRPHPNT